MTSTLGRNYARAIFDLAKETSSLDEVQSDLRAARDALHADVTVRDFLGNRLIGRTAKKALMRTGFEGKVDERVLTLLFLLVDRGRTRLLAEIMEEFERLSRLARGVRRVKVSSAFPLGEEEKGRLVRSLEARLGARVELETEVRPSLVGGVITESEGQEIEYSVQGELQSLKDDLSGRGER